MFIGFGSIDPLPHGQDIPGGVHPLPQNQKHLPLSPFLLKYFGDFLVTVFFSLKEMQVSQLRSAGVCTHLFVYFVERNWEYAWKRESVSVMHSKQI